MYQDLCHRNSVTQFVRHFFEDYQKGRFRNNKCTVTIFYVKKA